MNKLVIVTLLSILLVASQAHLKRSKIELVNDSVKAPVKSLTPVRATTYPAKVIGGYLCGNNNLATSDAAQRIVDAGFNLVMLSFFDIDVSGGAMTIAPNKCCGIDKPYDLAQALIDLGVVVMISSGGDGCQGAPASGFELLSADAILTGFEEFRASTGVDFHGIDIDWESSNADSSPNAINQLGRALRPAGYFVSAVPMSSQFNPGALQGWHNLDPSAIDAVLPQWYQGGCVGTQSCPCWGEHAVDVVPNATCPGFTQSYMQQARVCSTKQWIDGFKTVGSYSWDPSSIIIGAKSWCGGDQAAPCQSSDTGIWGYAQMNSILSVTGVRGVYMWDINDYFDDDYGNAGNPINEVCHWTNEVAKSFGLPASTNYTSSTAAYCANYTGLLPTNCQANPWG